MRRCLPGTFAIVLSATWAAAAEAPAPGLTVILTPQRANALGLEALAPVLAVSPRGTIVVAEPNNLLALNRREFLLDAPASVSDCAFTPDGALLAISGRSLGFCAGGRFHPQLDLPENAMRLAIGQTRIYVYGGDGEKATSLYVVEPQRGHARLCTLPHPVGAASTAGDTLYFAAGNDLYRLVPGGEIELVCHLPGPAIASVAAAEGGTVHFIAGRTLYVWQAGRVGIISEGVGDTVCRHNGGLYLLNVEKRSLIRLENLPPLEEMPPEASDPLPDRRGGEIGASAANRSNRLLPINPRSMS